MKHLNCGKLRAALDRTAEAGCPHMNSFLAYAIPNHIEKCPVDAGVGREFGMKRGGHGSSLPDNDGIAAFGGEDFNAFSNVDDPGGTDENHFERRFAVISGQRAGRILAGEESAFADGAVDLASVGVTADADVEGPEASLGRVFHFGGEQNCAGAGAEGRLHFDELAELLESGYAEKLEEGAGFASRNNEAVDVIKLLGLSDEHNFGAQLFKPAAVSVEIALQGQDTNGHAKSNRRGQGERRGDRLTGRLVALPEMILADIPARRATGGGENGHVSLTNMKESCQPRSLRLHSGGSFPVYPRGEIQC